MYLGRGLKLWLTNVKLHFPRFDPPLAFPLLRTSLKPSPLVIYKLIIWSIIHEEAGSIRRYGNRYHISCFIRTNLFVAQSRSLAIQVWLSVYPSAHQFVDRLGDPFIGLLTAILIRVFDLQILFTKFSKSYIFKIDL